MAQLIRLGGNVEPVNDPRVIALQLEHFGPGFVRLDGLLFFMRLEVDKSDTITTNDEKMANRVKKVWLIY